MSIKEKFENAKTKVTNWCDEHRRVIGNIIMGGGILGTAALVVYIANKNSIDSLDIPIPVGEGKQYTLPEWDESYRENWDKVKEFASALALKPGEMFVIEDGREYDRDVIVSHLVYGDGVYPPDRS